MRASASSTTVSWLPSPGDSDGTIKGYRIYRDGTSLANRYGSLLAASTTSFTDTAATEGHTYYVAAVDNNDAESAKTAADGHPVNASATSRASSRSWASWWRCRCSSSS